MKQKYTLIGVIVLVLLSGAVVFAMYRTNTPKPSTVAQIQKEAPANKETCDRGGPAKVPAADQTALEAVALSQLIDVPAGTHADVIVATYTGKTVTGSVKYEGSYGSYNFTAAKTGKATITNSDGSSANSGWELTSFVVCK